MRRQNSLLALCLGFVTAVISSGCVGNKNKDVAEAPVAAPPPAAYPEGPSGYPGTAGEATPSSQPNSHISSTPAPGASAPAPSAPVFELRAGEQLITHPIKRGDTLGAIAKKYNSSQSRIMAANGMRDTKIYAGKTLQVPTSAPPAELAMNGAGAGAAPAPPTSAAGSPYSAPSSSPYSAPSSSPYSAPASTPSPYSAPAPVTTPSSYGSGGYGSSTTGAPAPPSTPSQSPYSTSAPSPPVVPSSPSSTSFPRVQNAPAPPQQSASFPTPNLSSGSGQVQFSN